MAEELDFSEFFKPKEPEKEKEKKEIRKGFTTAKCCGNCQFFWYRQSFPRRGWCRLGKTKVPLPKDRRDRAYADENWPRVHSTNVCKKHKLKKIDASEKWVGGDNG